MLALGILASISQSTLFFFFKSVIFADSSSAHAKGAHRRREAWALRIQRVDADRFFYKREQDLRKGVRFGCK
jgi:hypothetical protein